MDEAAYDYSTEKLTLRRRIGKLITSGDWMARILIESVLVVVSILAALWFDEWQKTSDRQELAHQALSAFQREIQQNKARLQESGPYRQGLRDILIRMNEEGGIRTAEQFYAMVGVEPLRPPFVTSTVWETSLTTGALPNIDFDVVNALSLTYSLQERLSEFSRSSMPTLARGGSVPPEQMSSAIREVVIYLTDLGNSEDYILAHYEVVLRILADALPADSVTDDPAPEEAEPSA